MKRSEMLKIVYDKLDYTFIECSPFLDSIIKSCLDEFEKAGMMPPSNMSHTVECLEDELDSFYWEKENDEAEENASERSEGFRGTEAKEES